MQFISFRNLRGKIFHNVKNACSLDWPGIMSWIHGVKLACLAISATIKFISKKISDLVRITHPSMWLKAIAQCCLLLWRQSSCVTAVLWQADKPFQGLCKSVISSSGLAHLKLRCAVSRPNLVHQKPSWLTLPLWWGYILTQLPVRSYILTQLELHLLQIIRPIVSSGFLLLRWRFLSSSSRQFKKLLLVIEWRVA